MSDFLVALQIINNLRMKRNHPREVLKTTLVEMVCNVNVRERKLNFMTFLAVYFINTAGQGLT